MRADVAWTQVLGHKLHIAALRPGAPEVDDHWNVGQFSGRHGIIDRDPLRSLIVRRFHSNNYAGVLLRSFARRLGGVVWAGGIWVKHDDRGCKPDSQVRSLLGKRQKMRWG